MSEWEKCHPKPVLFSPPQAPAEGKGLPAAEEGGGGGQQRVSGVPWQLGQGWRGNPPTTSNWELNPHGRIRFAHTARCQECPKMSMHPLFVSQKQVKPIKYPLDYLQLCASEVQEPGVW